MLVIYLFTYLALMLGHGSKVVDPTYLSDNFEDYSAGTPPNGIWIKSGQGLITIDSTFSHSGAKSVKFITGESYDNRAFIGIYGSPYFPVPGNTYYASMYLWVDEASPDGIHWTMLQSSGKIKELKILSEVRYGGQHNKKLMANYDTRGANTDCWKHSDTIMPEKEWVKIAWFFDGSNNEMKLWINDRFIEDIWVKDKGTDCLSNDFKGIWKFPLFDNVTVGWCDYQTGGGTRTVWIDDFIFSRNPLPGME